MIEEGTFHCRMSPRSFIRWKSFWLGVVVLLFLCWGWWISYHHGSYANCGRMRVSHVEGHVALGSGGIASDIEWGHYPLEMLDRVFEFLPPPFFVRGEGKDPTFVELGGGTLREEAKTYYSILSEECWEAFLPHWLLVVLFAVPWACFLGWRWRRLRDLTNTKP